MEKARAGPSYWLTHQRASVKVIHFTIIVVLKGPGAGMAPVSPSFLAQVGRTLPEDGAVWGAYLDVAEAHAGVVTASNRNISFLAEIVRASEKQVVVEVDVDVWPPHGNLQLVPNARPDRAGNRLDL